MCSLVSFLINLLFMRLTKRNKLNQVKNNFLALKQALKLRVSDRVEVDRNYLGNWTTATRPLDDAAKFKPCDLCLQFLGEPTPDSDAIRDSQTLELVQKLALELGPITIAAA